MSESLKGVVVGQQLWFVPKHISPNGHGEQPRFVTVTKVGRKWVRYTDFNRCAEIATGRVFECSSSQYILGQCYVDRDKWLADAELRCAWDAFRRHVERLYVVPDRVTQEWLVEARRIIETK